ncbi:hypothetical protein R1flu_021486 [Riccia fluitans]|uniref:Uncharacterized protein n=1 Tax=Riccia fluitans TaxID=41844 RepID=A0ABD1ZPR0_9MARC
MVQNPLLLKLHLEKPKSGSKLQGFNNLNNLDQGGYNLKRPELEPHSHIQNFIEPTSIRSEGVIEGCKSHWGDYKTKGEVAIAIEVSKQLEAEKVDFKVGNITEFIDLTDSRSQSGLGFWTGIRAAQ